MDRRKLTEYVSVSGGIIRLTPPKGGKKGKLRNYLDSDWRFNEGKERGGGFFLSTNSTRIMISLRNGKSFR